MALINHKFDAVEGPLDTAKDMVCIAKPKYADVHICLADSLNIPVAQIELYSADKWADKRDTFEDSKVLGEEIAMRWNSYPKLIAEIAKLKACATAAA